MELREREPRACFFFWVLKRRRRMIMRASVSRGPSDVINQFGRRDLIAWNIVNDLDADDKIMCEESTVIFALFYYKSRRRIFI